MALLFTITILAIPTDRVNVNLDQIKTVQDETLTLPEVVTGTAELYASNDAMIGNNDNNANFDTLYASRYNVTSVLKVHDYGNFNAISPIMAIAMTLKFDEEKERGSVLKLPFYNTDNFANKAARTMINGNSTNNVTGSRYNMIKFL